MKVIHFKSGHVKKAKTIFYENSHILFIKNERRFYIVNKSEISDIEDYDDVEEKLDRKKRGGKIKGIDNQLTLNL